MNTDIDTLVFYSAIIFFGFIITLIVGVQILEINAAQQRTQICLDHGFYDYDENLDVCYSNPFDISEEYKPFQEVKEDKWFGKNCHLFVECLSLRTGALRVGPDGKPLGGQR